MSTSILFTYLLLSSQHASSLPVSTNKTALNTEIAPSWVPEPQGRGTWKLLYSCVFTLTLCVWTAIHLNIPPKGETWMQHWNRKMRWVFLGIFVPEVVVVEALIQWRHAKRLCKELNLAASRPPVTYDLSERVGMESSEPPPKDIPATFSIVYAFYCIMGGLVVDVSDIHDRYDRMSLGPQGVLWLAKKGHLLPIPNESIRDKSKADILAKGLVCFQVTWLLLQCIARKASGYPLTVLELHTLVHVFCALAIYSFWFHKPLDIKDPTVIDTTAFKSTLALMLMRTEGPNYDNYIIDGNSGKKTLALEGVFGYGTPESVYLRRFDPVLNSNPEEPNSPNCPASIEEPDITAPIQSKTEKDGDKSKLFTISPRPSNIQFLCKASAATEISMRLEPGQCLTCGFGPKLSGKYYSMDLSSKTILRWDFAAKDLGPNSNIKIPSQIRLLQGYPSRFLRASNLNLIFGSTWTYSRNENLSFSAIFLLSLCYGGIHTVAWNFDFPTNVERTIWRVACISAIAGFIGVTYLFSVIMWFTSDLSTGLSFSRLCARELRRIKCDGPDFSTFRKWDSLSGVISNIVEVSVQSFVVLSAISTPYLLLVRLFIVTESFISLRRVPIGVYSDVSWTQYIPHL